MKHGSNPGLSVVSDESLAEAEPEEAPGPEPREAVMSPRPGRLGLVLSGVALLAALLAAHQYGRAESLAAQVESLGGQLAVAQTQLARYQSHLGEIRGGVKDLDVRLGALRALVDRDPAAGAELQAPDPDASSGVLTEPAAAN